MELPKQGPTTILASQSMARVDTSVSTEPAQGQSTKIQLFLFSCGEWLGSCFGVTVDIDERRGERHANLK